MKYLYYCNGCGQAREDLLDKPDYSWACPRCKSKDITAEPVSAKVEEVLVQKGRDLESAVRGVDE